MNPNQIFFDDLQRFASAVHIKMNQHVSGEPEEQLRTPFENLMTSVGVLLDSEVTCTGETPLPNQIGKPDFAILRKSGLTGYVELKAPGVGAKTSQFKGRNKEQAERFAAIPNMLYSDGNEWAIYKYGELTGSLVSFAGDISKKGSSAVTQKDADELLYLLRNYLDWQPNLPLQGGKLDLKEFARQLAPLTRLLRDSVTDALGEKESNLNQIAKDWRELLFPHATDEQFADSYAQTVTFALLLGRSEGANPLTLSSAQKALAAQHNLLSRALLILTDEQAKKEIEAPLDLLIRVISAVPPDTFGGPKDPWLYFYEDFLAAYDADLRRDAGVYYTPIEVVRCQVRLVDDLLVNTFKIPKGFSDPKVITLDPAVGTGTYLLGVIEHALQRTEAEEGKGAVAAQATQLAKNLYGFEIMVGPYAVSELRVSRSLLDRGAQLPSDGTQIYLTDTLESPNAEPPVLPAFYKAISDQQQRALKVKSKVPIIVCIGNPPYDRHDKLDPSKKSLSGGWVHWGDSLEAPTGILRDFIEPAKKAGHGGDIRNIYNLYVYFWRWAMWKVFEAELAEGPGVVSFITASSFIEGDAFSGMRSHMRKHCDSIWIIDLGGDSRGARKEDNVFAIQTPVCICIAVRNKIQKSTDQPADVKYARITGTKAQKLEVLGKANKFADFSWERCPSEPLAHFRPPGQGTYFDWPQLIDLMPWQHSGAKLHRTWPICHDPDTLKLRWKTLLKSKNEGDMFRETDGRKFSSSYEDFEGKKQIALSKENPETSQPKISRYAYRSFDRQWVIEDTRVGDRFRPDLWNTCSDDQIFFSTMFQRALESGPGLTCSSLGTDLNHFCNRGAKDTIPLYRDNEAKNPNLHPDLVGKISQFLSFEAQACDVAAYFYGVLAHPEFISHFYEELDTRELRVPITKDPVLFEKARAIGANLIWLHTYGERMVPPGKQRGHIPSGSARCEKAISETDAGYPEDFAYDPIKKILRVGDGEFQPIEPDVFNFEVSGLKVVQSWLKYRMKDGAGKQSSKLDKIRPLQWTSAFTTELLELLWVLEATVTGYQEQKDLLHQIIQGECLHASDLPPVPENLRRLPKALGAKETLFDNDGQEK
jgi:hypothetical protein